MTVFDKITCYEKHKKQNKILRTISFIIFWEFLMFYQISLLPQVKRWAIITYRHGTYKLPHLLLNELRPKILGN